MTIQCVCQVPGWASPPEALRGLVACVEGADISLQPLYKRQQQFTARFLLITQSSSLSFVMMFHLQDAQYLKFLSNMF